MDLRFQTGKTTRVRFLSRPLKREEGFYLLDPGARFRTSFPFLELIPGEAGKRWRELERILEWLSSQRAERNSRLIVVGGGAALDLGALAASLYRRGMGLVLVPTTLLGMVDATLGGKTAVDRESPEGLGKNFAGTFYPADEVWIYPPFLSTLPLRERISGAGEVWKTLWLAGKKEDGALLAFVGEGKVSPKLTSLLRLCLETKKKIVEKDPLDEKRIRECLNYGHTVGHALESLSEGKLSHGEAVLWGMRVESGLLGKKAAKMTALADEKIRALGLTLPEAFSLPAERWLPFLKADKKSKKGKIEMSVLEAPGRLHRLRRSPEALAAKIKAFPESFRP